MINFSWFFGFFFQTGVLSATIFTHNKSSTLGRPFSHRGLWQATSLNIKQVHLLVAVVDAIAKNGVSLNNSRPTYS